VSQNQAAAHSTFWLLYGQHGATMSFEKFCAEFFPGLTHKAIRNRISAGNLPRPINDVFDVRDVSDWWDACRLRAKAS
jgi:hypothetical protein